MITKGEKKSYKEPASLDAQERLVKIMNDSPSIIKLANTEWEIKPLRNGTQWLIAEEVCKIEGIENKTAGEAFVGLTKSMPSVIRIITLALLNDKDRIENEYDSVYETIQWESTNRDWAKLLQEIFLRIDVGFFFQITDAVKMLKDLTTEKKMTMKEVKSLSQEHLGGK